MASFISRVLRFMAVAATSYALLFVLFLFVLFGFIAAFSPKPQPIAKRSVLVINLGFDMPDAPADDDPVQVLSDAIQQRQSASLSLREAVQAVDEAARDHRISALLIQGNGASGSLAALRELRSAIERFAADKPAYAYLDFDSTRDLYLKSAATHRFAHPRAFLDFRGLRAEYMYLGEAFDRLGIDWQMEQLHEFKTVGETYTRKAMSTEERLQTSALITGIWQELTKAIADGIGVDPVRLDHIAATNLLIVDEQLVDYGFAQDFRTREELIEEILPLSEWDDSVQSFRQIDLVAYAKRHADDLGRLLEAPGRDQIGVLYLDGIIVDGESGTGTVGSDTIIDLLRELRDDDSVKAVVVRINSPGGSAIASARIYEEILRTNAAKPVIISMGGIAASGGYMAAAGGDYIFAEAATITGSIGVAQLFFNFKELTDRLSVYFDGVETHPFAGSFMPTRPLNNEELRQRRAYAERTYKEFIHIVATGRSMQPDAVDTVARGRVWLGRDAVPLGLVDEIGGLQDAIARAAAKAGIGDKFSLLELPRPLTIEEKILSLLQTTAARPAARLLGSYLGPSHNRRALRLNPADQLLAQLEIELRRLQALNDPNHTYLIAPFHLHLQ